MVGKLIAVFGIAALSVLAARSYSEEKLRKESPFSFPDGLTEDDFRQIVEDAAKRIRKRYLKVRVEGSLVSGSFDSQSGLNTYSFSIDFNDYGKLTGKYWLRSDNADSAIPVRLASTVREEIEARLNTAG